MTTFTTRFAALACTAILSFTCVVAAVGPAQGVPSSTVRTALVA